MLLFFLFLSCVPPTSDPNVAQLSYDLCFCVDLS